MAGHVSWFRGSGINEVGELDFVGAPSEKHNINTRKPWFSV